jgi:hypothetical protein
MSWDILVLNYQGAPPEDPDDESVESLPLGKPVVVRQSISDHLPRVDWSDPTWGIYETDTFSFEFNMGDEDPIEDIMVHVRGGGEVIPALMAFANPNQWSLLDCSTGEFLDPQHPSSAGWEAFQVYRDQVIGNQSVETP